MSVWEGGKGARGNEGTWRGLGAPWKGKGGIGWRQQALAVTQKEESLECTITTSVSCLSQVGYKTRDKSQEKLDDCKAMKAYSHLMTFA